MVQLVTLKINNESYNLLSVFCVYVYITDRVFLYEISNMSVYPQHTDMSEEMRVETMELCVTACEKFATNNEVRPHYVLSCYA